ncbi:MAG: hypothetical protein DWQ01_01545 [Planctomycetota bacterium]|nr:MAG: hypothetical protein DWQ01_01545 [Planctomycetota bacterium]
MATFPGLSLVVLTFLLGWLGPGLRTSESSDYDPDGRFTGSALYIGCKLKIPDLGNPYCFGLCPVPETCNSGSVYTDVDDEGGTYYWCDVCGHPGSGQECDGYYVEENGIGLLVCSNFNCGSTCQGGYHGHSFQWCKCP